MTTNTPTKMIITKTLIRRASTLLVLPEIELSNGLASVRLMKGSREDLEWLRDTLGDVLSADDVKPELVHEPLQPKLP